MVCEVHSDIVCVVLLCCCVVDCCMNILMQELEREVNSLGLQLDEVKMQTVSEMVAVNLHHQPYM